MRRLGPPDAKAYLALRLEMLADTPVAFLASPESDVACDPKRLRELLAQGDANVILGAFAPGLVGSVGIARETHPKGAHKATVWGMYVTPAARRRGVGRLLMEGAVSHARALPGVSLVHLAVNHATPGARALYKAVGFRRWGTEPRAICIDGIYSDEDHMVLDLEQRP